MSCGGISLLRTILSAPRVWFDEYWHIGYRDGMQNYPTDPRVNEAARRTALEGWEIGVRLKHLDAEGVRKEIVFPHSLISFVRYPSPAHRFSVPGG